MTAINDLFGGGLPVPDTGNPQYKANQTTGTAARPWLGVDPAIHQTGQWTSSTSTTSHHNDELVEGLYRESFRGRLFILTAIVSDNADYLIKQIDIDVQAKDTVVTVNIGKNKMTPPLFVFPGGKITHTRAKKYMDWLAMVQLILQDA